MLKLGLLNVFLEFLILVKPSVGIYPLRVWQLSNNTYGYRSDGVPPIYPQGTFCGQFGEGPPGINFPFQAISFDGAQTSFIDVELHNSDIGEDWSLIFHLYPRSNSARVTVFSYSSTGGQGVTEMTLYLAHGRPMFVMNYNNEVACGSAKIPAQLPLNTWSFLSLHRENGRLEFLVNNTITVGTDNCQYGSYGPPNGTLRIAAHQFSTQTYNFDGMMECLIVYDHFVQTPWVTSGEIACSSSSIQQPETYNFHSCGQTDSSVTHGNYILDHINYSPDLSTSIHKTTARSVTECAKFCSSSNSSCRSFSLRKETVGHSCFLFDFIANAMTLLAIPQVRYYISRV